MSSSTVFWTEITAEPLPWCAYPRAADVERHWVQPLPATLPLADFSGAEPHRSLRHQAVPVDRLSRPQVLELARVVADSFARREPQCRHLRPAASPPLGLAEWRHSDAFGSEAFGAWTRESLLYWFIRLLILTDPTSPVGAVRVNEEALAQSVAIVDERGRVIGGGLNETRPAPGVEVAFRAGDPFLEAMLAFVEPVMRLLGRQDVEAGAALAARYPAYAAALAAGRVGHHFMVARSDALAKEDAFELVAATAERYRELGFEYVVVEATNQWTGAACEVLGGVRVHFAPFRVERVVRASAEAVEGETTSPSGFVAEKDSGSMLYVIRLA